MLKLGQLTRLTTASIRIQEPLDFTCADGTECRQFEVTATVCPVRSLPRCAIVVFGDRFFGAFGKPQESLWPACSGMNQRPSAQLHRERLASAAAAPPIATTDEAGTVLGVSRAQARRLATELVRGRLPHRPRGGCEPYPVTGDWRRPLT